MILILADLLLCCCRPGGGGGGGDTCGSSKSVLSLQINSVGTQRLLTYFRNAPDTGIQ